MKEAPQEAEIVLTVCHPAVAFQEREQGLLEGAEGCGLLGGPTDVPVLCWPRFFLTELSSPCACSPPHLEGRVPVAELRQFFLQPRFTRT